MPSPLPTPSYANPMWGDDWPEVRALWALDPGWTHLNHGSFGAVPRPVLAAQDRWRARGAANAVRHVLLDEREGLVGSRRRAAAFLGSDPDGIVLVPNATTGACTALASVALAPGDEVVVTDQGYGALRFAVERVAAAAGARVVEVPLDVRAPADEIVATVTAAIGHRARLLVVDHITSATARLFPVRDLVAAAHQRGVPVLVDGAHAPAQIEVDLASLGADFWVGNFHKWPCAVRGTAALYVSPEWRDRVRPLVTSWTIHDGYPAAFDETGTEDRSAWLALGDALALMESLSLQRLRSHGSDLAAYGQHVVADALEVPADRLWGDDGVWMRCIPLPPGAVTTETAKRALWRRISDELHCDVAVTLWAGQAAIRVSAHAYNAPAEYERLALGLRALL